jgi:ABC-type branched-subunit amino acid transport system permease subunit
MKALAENPTIRRLVACLFGGFVMALMIGTQEGSQNDFGVSFEAATKPVRLTIFLLIGLAIFLLLTFWPLVAPFVHHPGANALGIGFIGVLSGMTLTKWYDPVGKFNTVSKEVSHSHGAPFLVSLFFSPVGWVLMLVGLLLGAVAVATRRAVLGWVQFGYSVLAAVIAFVAHHELTTFAKEGPDHTLGVFVTVIGYGIFATAGLIVAHSKAEVADPVGSLERALAWRPGLPLAAVAFVLGLNSFLGAAWFAPQQRNTHFFSLKSLFKGTGLAPLANAYISWLGIVLFVVSAVLVLVACYYRNALTGWISAVLGLAGVIATFFSLHEITVDGAHNAMQYGATWDNLGSAGWDVCLAFAMILGAGVLAATGVSANLAVLKAQADGTRLAPKRSAQGSAISRSVIPFAIAIALFYPPTLPGNWQNVVVTQIAVYLLLAVGLNVVVGWAGLLDLGYIAFFGIGSYTTAYVTASLPHKPPSWLHLSPLEAIPFAIIACLIAGVLLGAPTLRLRGDYLAIVTLGFGELVELVAINNPGNITGGPIGPRVPHPRVRIGPLHITWGLDNLPYWYLLIFLLGIVLVLFYRLEGSRLGRAWAAIREDEVAAQATGVRTTRVKLLAFSIGASTSGVAGVFFASTIGYFDPSAFTLQYSILIVAYVVFGGMGSLAGAVAGAAALTWLPYFLQSQVPLPDAQMWIGAIIIIMMIFRPAGLIPAKRRKAELHGLDAPASSEVTAVPAGGAMS